MENIRRPVTMPGAPDRVRRRRRRTVMIVTIGGVVLLAVLALALWNVLVKAAPDVTLYNVGAGAVNTTIGGGGIVYPRQQLDISYPSAERVISVFVKAGDSVAPNQSLIQLDPSRLNAEIAQAASDMAAAQAYLNTVSHSGNATTIAQAQQAYNMAKNKYDALVAEASSPTLHHGMLISPMSGIVTSVDVDPGEIFAADVPLLTIMDESTVIVRVKIPLANLGGVSIGQSAVVTPSALPNQSFAGKVISIVPKADPQTDTFEVWVEVANPHLALLPGMSAFVRIQGKNTAVILPRLSVLNPDRDALVFVVTNAHAFVRHVHIVGRTPDQVYVDAGVSKGDRVVIVGAQQLRDGQVVRVTQTE